MQLGMTLKLGGATPSIDIETVLEAERLGFSQVWSGESYSTDAISPVAWVLARTTRIKAGTGIMQIPARTPRLNMTDPPPVPGFCRVWPLNQTGAVDIHFAGDKILLRPWVAGPP